MDDYKKQKECAKKLADSVRDEMIRYFNIEEKPDVRLRTNTDLASEYSKMTERKSSSKCYISRILKKHVPAKLLRFREEELKYQSQYSIKFKTQEENSVNGKKGADVTNKIKSKKKGLLDILLAKESLKKISNNLL